MSYLQPCSVSSAHFACILCIKVLSTKKQTKKIMKDTIKTKKRVVDCSLVLKKAV